MKSIFKYKKMFLLLVGYILFLVSTHQINAENTLRPVSSVTCESKKETCILPDEFDSSKHTLINDIKCSDPSKLCVKEKETECLTGINADQGTAWKDRTRLCTTYLSTYIEDESEQKNWTKRDDLHCDGLFTDCWEKKETTDTSTKCEKGTCIVDRKSCLGYIYNSYQNDGYYPANCVDENNQKGVCCVEIKELKLGCLDPNSECLDRCDVVNKHSGVEENRVCKENPGIDIGSCCIKKVTNTKDSVSSINPSSNSKTNPSVNSTVPVKSTQNLTTAQKQSFCDGSPKTTEVASNPQNYDSNVLTYEECIAWSKTDTAQFQKFIAENNPGVSTAWKETLTKIQSQIKPVDGVSSGVFSNISNEIKQMDSIIQQQQKQYAQNLNKFIETGSNVKVVSNPLLQSNVNNTPVINSTTSPIVKSTVSQPIVNNSTITMQSYIADCKQAATNQGMMYYLAENGQKCQSGFIDIINYSSLYNLHCCGATSMITQCTRDKGVLRERCLSVEQVYAQWQTTSGILYCCSPKK